MALIFLVEMGVWYLLGGDTVLWTVCCKRWGLGLYETAETDSGSELAPPSEDAGVGEPCTGDDESESTATSSELEPSLAWSV